METLRPGAVLECNFQADERVAPMRTRCELHLVR